ncbi:class I SAM-dependent methyltransferase [Streptomyces sp.]|uniref:class I SAM-dependent methyltransferase n=1 Tax=Streptomyces sp. TaxID=1931 RepID=UPI002F3E5973
MPFDHNDHYHRLLVRQVSRTRGVALDVGCGTGRFAWRLAGLGMEVDAVDPSEEVIAAARARSEGRTGGPVPRFTCADVTETDLPKGRYDVISCLASIHHMPFGTVAALREALAPGGVLVILGCYPERSRTDWTHPVAGRGFAAAMAASPLRLRPPPSPAPAGRRPRGHPRPARPARSGQWARQLTLRTCAGE